MAKKIWVKRSGASATLISINEGDLVDDIRDMILRKYANSLGRSFDAPDVSLRIIPREASSRTSDRMLGPEESMLKTLELYFPGGQTVDEALIIDVPRRNTPRPSPGLAGYGSHSHRYSEDHRPLENGSEYFPPMPMPVNLSPGLHSINSQESRHSHHPPHTSNPHAISVLETGQIAPLPSPRGKVHRPKYPRHNTTSPTVVSGTTSSLPAMVLHHQPRQGRIRHDSTLSEQKHPVHTSAPQPLPTPPLGENGTGFGGRLSGPSTPRVASPRPTKSRKSRKQAYGNDLPPTSQPAYSSVSGIVDASVPPINVLIVEDNPINLRLLEAFVKRLKVRWSTAMNGRDAVLKWRGGGFHLVLMDIQLPIMSGLEATKEIRRLERVNGIGVFARNEDEARSSTPIQGEANDDAKAATEPTDPQSDADKLKLDGLLKSPVIIVALTASSLQSDRHEALAAGCNDFLTKPVSFPWFERKVMEWGCMQALIDFDGWRKWKDFAAANAKEADGKKADKKEGKTAEDRAKRMSLKASAAATAAATAAAANPAAAA